MEGLPRPLYLLDSAPTLIRVPRRFVHVYVSEIFHNALRHVKFHRAMENLFKFFWVK